MRSGADVLNEILNELSVKAPTLAKEVGLKYQRLLDIQTGKVKKISSPVANAINGRYPQFSLSYLLTGEREAVVGNEVNGNGNVIGNNNEVQHFDVINKLVDEISAQRRQNDKLIAIIEEQTKALTNKDR